VTTRQLPTNDQVRLAMDLVLQESAETGRRPTITAVEDLLDVPTRPSTATIPN
jgi:hypothetical protein